MLVNLNKFELLDFLNGCAIGSHLRQGVWRRCVDEFYDKLSDDEREFIHDYSLKNFWEIMAREKYPNYKEEYPKEGFDDYVRFLACFNPDNRYRIKIADVVYGKKQERELAVYKYKDRFWLGFDRPIPTEIIKSIKKIGE